MPRPTNDAAFAAAIASGYYAALPHKTTANPKSLILFSGVPGAGKTTIATAIQARFSALRISNDEIRDRILAAQPSITGARREHIKFLAGETLLTTLAQAPNGLIVADISCDRSANYYGPWAKKHGYQTLVLRLDIPRAIIEQRLHARGGNGYRVAADLLASLDAFWQDWELFGQQNTIDFTITPNTPLNQVLAYVQKVLYPQK